MSSGVHYTAPFITGSTLVSGSDFRGPTATITNVNITNITGSGNLIIYGSTTLSGSLYITGSTQFNQTIGQLKSGSYYGGAEPASYIIWSGSGQYWVKNSSTGKIDFSGSTFSTLLESAMGTLSNGGKIFAKAGTYAVTTQIDIPYSNITLQGCGMGTMLIGGISGTDNIIQADGKNGIIIDSLYIEGQNGVGGNLLNILNSSDSIVSNCYLKNAYHRCIAFGNERGYRNKIINNTCITSGYGSPAADAETIVLGESDKCVVIGNTVSGSYQGGITFSGCNDCLIEGNTVNDSDGQDVGYGGIDFEQAVRSIASNNTIKGTGRGVRISRNSLDNLIVGNSIYSTKDGIVVIVSSGTPTGSSIINNIIHGGTALATSGIVIGSTCTDSLVKGNIIYSSQYSGMEIAADRTAIIGNKVYNCDQSGSGWHGIYIPGANYCIINDNDVYDTKGTPTQDNGIRLNNASYCVITGNRVRNNAIYGIYTDGTSDYNLIVGNVCAGNLHANYDIVYAGSNNKVAWNIGRYISTGSA